MRKLLIAAATLTFTATPALANDNAMIQAADDALAAAFNKGDTAAVGAMYAADATLLPSDNKLYKGAAITAWWAGAATAIVGSPTPPQKPPDGMTMVSTSGISAMRITS